ncbi:LOW QUALITY PROTEIN: centrosomal protein of 72 kDa [Heterocephalus glaber]|uniref:LOW QUALITY PROTEIN: centrosomal protein of 72 kDa n=1 Tax=Heterocephalus glaber TaxID=10181 RepID=A0AAX6SWI2_HETGA|nr:LOW QUALITY PROTEIN: centrosomal protein of 72 kDa [Heterocephalus glaber]
MAPAPGSRLVLREETLGERSGLGPHHDLAELQSLSIPGTYQEKITHLGSSLMHFTSLKSLDLSHNSLVSLEFNKIESRHLLSPAPIQHQCGDPVRRGHDKRRAGSSMRFPEQLAPHQPCGELPLQHGEPEACCVHSLHPCTSIHPDSTDIEHSSSSQKPSLSSQKVLNPSPIPERYRKCRMPGGRFQELSDQECLSHPERAGGPCSLRESLTMQDSSGGRSQRAFSLSRVLEAEEQTFHSLSNSRVPPPASHLAAPLGRRAPLEVVLLEALLHLVDKHWSGCRSLHRNETFLAQARHVLSSVQELAVAQGSVTPGDVEVSCLALENQSLHRQLAEQHQQYTETMDEGTAELSSTQQEMDILRQHLDRSLEENNSLKSLLFNMKKEVKNGEMSAALNVQISGLQTSVKQLSGEVVELKQHLKHYDKIQELTQMLQESHSSLLSTSEHLLQELSRERAQHRAEVEQMRWSFQELKKTTALFPPHSASLGGRQSC